MTDRETASVQGEDRGRRIAAFNPFWRYAVALGHRRDIPAIPYFTRRAAERFAAESRRQFPYATTLLLKRAGWHSFEVLSDDRA